MSTPPTPSYGRAAVIGVLVALLLTIAAAVYAFATRYQLTSPAPQFGVMDPAAEAQQRTRITVLLAILLISALLLLLFVIGCYLVIRIGRVVRRPVAGAPTEYVDAWRQYRLTDEQIAAATDEPPDTDTHEPPRGRGPRPPGSDPKPSDWGS